MKDLSYRHINHQKLFFILNLYFSSKKIPFILNMQRIEHKTIGDIPQYIPVVVTSVHEKGTFFVQLQQQQTE